MIKQEVKYWDKNSDPSQDSLGLVLQNYISENYKICNIVPLVYDNGVMIKAILIIKKNK